MNTNAYKQSLKNAYRYTVTKHLRKNKGNLDSLDHSCRISNTNKMHIKTVLQLIKTVTKIIYKSNINL